MLICNIQVQVSTTIGLTMLSFVLKAVACGFHRIDVAWAALLYRHQRKRESETYIRSAVDVTDRSGRRSTSRKCFPLLHPERKVIFWALKIQRVFLWGDVQIRQNNLIHINRGLCMCWTIQILFKKRRTKCNKTNQLPKIAIWTPGNPMNCLQQTYFRPIIGLDSVRSRLTLLDNYGITVTEIFPLFKSSTIRDELLLSLSHSIPSFPASLGGFLSIKDEWDTFWITNQRRPRPLQSSGKIWRAFRSTN